MSIEHHSGKIARVPHLACYNQTEPHHSMDAYNQYGQYQRYRQMSLDDMLLENRIVFLIGEISYDRAAEVIMKMLYMQRPPKIGFRITINCISSTVLC